VNLTTSCRKCDVWLQATAELPCRIVPQWSPSTNPSVHCLQKTHRTDSASFTNERRAV